MLNHGGYVIIWLSVNIYIMAGRAFVVAKEVFHHKNCNILKPRMIK